MKTKSRSTTNNPSLKIINNDMEKYNNKPKNSASSHERTFTSIPTELFILINNLQTDKIFDVVRKIKVDGKKVERTIKAGLTPSETRYLQTVMGLSDGFELPYDTMCKLTGLYDSGVTEAKNELIKKGFLSLTEDGQLKIEYGFMYKLYDSMYAEACTNLVYHDKNDKNHMSQLGTSAYPDVGHDDDPTQDMGMPQLGTQGCTNLVHIQDNQEKQEKKEKIIDNKPAGAGSVAGATVSKLSSPKKPKSKSKDKYAKYENYSYDELTNEMYDCNWGVPAELDKYHALSKIRELKYPKECAERRKEASWDWDNANSW